MLDWCFSWAEGELFTPSHYLTSIGISYNINPRWATHHRRLCSGKQVRETSLGIYCLQWSWTSVGFRPLQHEDNLELTLINLS